MEKINKINPVEIGSTLSKIRKNNKLTQLQLSEKISISPTHISTVENVGSYSDSVICLHC